MHMVSTAGQCRAGHLDSHQVGQGPPLSSSSFSFVVAGHLPYPRPLPEAPPQAPAPPLVARPRHLPYTFAHAAPADAQHQARHQHDVLWHHPDASEQHHPPPSVGYTLSYGKHALPPLRAK